MTVSVKHSLYFVTDFDETTPNVKQFLKLSESDQVKLLEATLLELLKPHVEPLLDTLNLGNRYATLKLAK